MKKRFAIAAAALLASTLAGADAGAPAYPGAKPDKDVAAVLEKSMHVKAETWRTADPVAKVADFYRKQGLKEMPGTSKEAAVFTTKSGAMMTIQNPWMDMKTGALNHDTLVTIPKK